LHNNVTGNNCVCVGDAGWWWWGVYKTIYASVTPLWPPGRAVFDLSQNGLSQNGYFTVRTENGHPPIQGVKAFDALSRRA
jgi:hypothetical protein